MMVIEQNESLYMEKGLSVYIGWACSKYMCGGQTGINCLPCSLPQLVMVTSKSRSSRIRRAVCPRRPTLLTYRK